jgi:hypothetical protein
MNLLRRFPDKPWRRDPKSLPDLDMQGGYIATAKYDGWRCAVTINDDISFWSRVNKPLPVADEMRKAVKFLDLPPATVLDTEWMRRRPDYDGPELLYVIGMPWFNGEWLGRDPEAFRWDKVIKIFEGVFSKLDDPEAFPLQLPKWVSDGKSLTPYSELFAWSKTDKTTEGIVLKGKLSKLVGDTKESKKNPNWIKIKWRDGADGRTVVA